LSSCAARSRFSNSIAACFLHTEGVRRSKRFKSGGKVKHQTNIAIVVPHHKPPLGPADAAGMMQGAPPPAPPPMGVGAPVLPGRGVPGAPAQFRRGGAASGVNRLDERERLKRGH
jgi:hypothetical protein